MKIAFLDCIGWDYSVESAYQRPLGGTQSAVCYLSEALARRGHDVSLLNNTSEPGLSRGVRCCALQSVPGALIRGLDALVEVNTVGAAAQLKPALQPGARVVLWCQHAHDQPAVQALSDASMVRLYDRIALLSRWQSDRFEERFRIPPSQIVLMRNAVGPAFAHLFSKDAVITAEMADPPVLAYTSTPFRGLNLLLEAFPIIRTEVPGVRLKVFSSMQLYYVPEGEDEHRPLYEACRSTPGVEYVGALAQPDLAEAMKRAAILAYPNTFPETSCIAALEAMASGCRVVTSGWGALPETTAGFARLVPVDEDWEGYTRRFAQAVLEVLEAWRDAREETESLLRRQVDFVSRSATWDLRAEQWLEMLDGIRPV